MDIELLHTFIEVANAGSFAKAAKDRNMDPSSISRAIATLEQHVGARLFQRTTRNMSLTEAGMLYLARITPICEELERAQNDVTAMQGQLKGTIRFTTSVSFGQACIVPLLKLFREQYPDLQLELSLNDANIDLITEQIDLAIRLNKSADNRFIRTLLRPSHYKVCATPDYLKQHPDISDPHDIQRHQCLLLNLPRYREKWTFINSKDERSDIPVNGHITLSSAMALKECTKDSLGIALLADWLIEKEIASGELIDIFPNHAVSAANFDTAIWLVYPNRAFLPTKTRLLIEFLKEYLAA